MSFLLLVVPRFNRGWRESLFSRALLGLLEHYIGNIYLCQATEYASYTQAMDIYAKKCLHNIFQRTFYTFHRSVSISTTKDSLT
jgi:hypothetical protein